MIAIRLSIDFSSPYRAIQHREVTDKTIGDVELKLANFLSSCGVDGTFHGLMRITTVRMPQTLDVKYDYFDEAANIAVFLVRENHRIFNCRLSLPVPEYKETLIFRLKSGQNAEHLDDNTIRLLLDIPSLIADGFKAIDLHESNIAGYRRIIEEYRDRIGAERLEILWAERVIKKLGRLALLAKELGYPVDSSKR